MELLVLDKNYQEIGRVEELSSMSWNRKYYDVGDFQINCGFDKFALFTSGEYLFRDGYELGVIESISYERSEDNRLELSIKGRFIESILDDRVIIGEQTFNGTHEEIARSIINANFINPSDINRKVANMQFGNVNLLGESTSLEIKNKIIGDKLFEFLKENEISQRLDFDYLTNQLIYSVWKGVDRTETIVFSDNNDNIGSIEYSIDKSDYSNFCYIQGKDVQTTVNLVGIGERRREIITTSSETNVTDLQNKGSQQLAKNIVVEVVDCNILENKNMKYRIDFDLGDICTVVLTQINLVVELRITEIDEVYENGNIIAYPKFGEDFISLRKYIEREVE